MYELQVGQALWFVPLEPHRNPPYAITITRIGRVWFYATQFPRGVELKLDRETLRENRGDFGWGGRAWVSKEAWDVEVVRQEAWRTLREVVAAAWNAPPGLTKEMIDATITMLKEGRSRG